jgi:SAM-dependent methyltransferase
MLYAVRVWIHPRIPLVVAGFITMASMLQQPSRSRKRSSSTSSCSESLSRSVFCWILVLSNILVFQLSRHPLLGYTGLEPSTEDLLLATAPVYTPARSSLLSPASPNTSALALAVAWDPFRNPLEIPPGQAPNLPSIRVSEANVDKRRHKNTKYGGTGDKQHLGGFTAYDGAGVSPSVWQQMMETWGVHSLLDVGCGRGTSTTWFWKQGVKVLCVEGSHDAIQHTILPDPATQVVEHDFSRGPWWPNDTYDAVWCVEFLEHISRQYHYNYMTTFRKAAIIFATSSRWGGWHHVEVHPDDWWITKMESYGFKYSAALSDEVRRLAKDESRNKTNIGPDGGRYIPAHVGTSMKVFINPVVAALRQHAHLFPQDGCFKLYEKGVIYNKACDPNKMETTLPASYAPLKFNAAKHDEWLEMVQKSMNMTAISAT